MVLWKYFLCLNGIKIGSFLVQKKIIAKSIMIYNLKLFIYEPSI